LTPVASSSTPSSLEPLWAVLRQPRLRRLQAAALVAQASGFAYGTALAVWAFEQAGAAGAGVFGASVFFPAAVLAPFLALLADRYRRDRILALSALLRAALLVATATAMTFGAPLALVAALAAAASVLARLYYPAHAALLPALTNSEEQLPAANALSSAIENVSMIAGPAIGGCLLALAGPGLVVTLAGACALLVACMVTGLRPTVETAPPRPNESIRSRDLAAGFAVIARTPVLTVAVAVLALGAFVFGALTVLIVALAIDELHVDGAAVGLLNGAVAVGGVAGGVTGMALASRRTPDVQLPPATTACAALLLSVAFAPGLAPAIVLLALIGTATAVVDVAAYTLIQRQAPDRVRARVFGAIEGTSVTACALGTLTGGISIELGGARLTSLALGVCMLLGALAAQQRLSRLDHDA
jgi:MFS family permease